VNDKQVSEGVLKFSIISLTDIISEETILTVIFDTPVFCEDVTAIFALNGNNVSDSMTDPIILNYVDASVSISGIGHDLSTVSCTEASKCQRAGCNYIATEALGHDLSPATCTEASKCKRNGCNHTEGTALGHNYGSVVTAPTCTTGGYRTHTCTRCNHSYTDSETLALGHTWNNGVVEKEPTIDEVGKKLFTCTVCSATKTEDIPKLTYVVGDIDGNTEITSSDAVYLLMHTFYPEDYPVEQESDFNGDGSVNSSDAVYLLMYTFYPEDYPLMHSSQTSAILTIRKKED
jgi:hypothetical protein